MLGNIHRAESSKVFEAADFVPQLPEPDESDDVEAEAPEAEVVIDLEERSRAIAAVFGRRT